MQEQNEQPNLERSVNRHPGQPEHWKILVCLIGVALTLNVALTAAALNFLMPTVVDHEQGIAARLDWYLHKGQLRADARTLAAAFEYLNATDRDVDVSTTNLAVLPAAENVAPIAPKS